MAELFRTSDGYRETIQQGLAVVRSLRGGISLGSGSRKERVERLREALSQADAVVVGAGAGLSTAAGLTYSGERFERVLVALGPNAAATLIVQGLMVLAVPMPTRMVLLRVERDNVTLTKLAYGMGMLMRKIRITNNRYHEVRLYIRHNPRMMLPRNKTGTI